ncbi:PEP-CTERM sorting domain-containing protein [Thalassotalea profundi]|uniref:Ice-binding protein C-terminal domain-containing protein n=1 Tax=Thalassotalea profundi TaxID=2036687 RepID=A0ABQ3IQT6_9GAMM|nr:PEP-CTERM sorting domain-containing protein [Thalassotalea profundi]GHE88523.1 hypothetical protein GCM10011501_17420 [Thalassotalea profundi]
MKFKIIKSVFASLILSISCLSQFAYAGLITSDDVYNDGSLEWLHFNFTVGLSSTASLNTYEDEGFRFATADEATTLVNDWFGLNLDAGNTNVSSPAFSDLIDSWNEEFTINYTTVGSYGLVANYGLFGARRDNNFIFSNYYPAVYGAGGDVSPIGASYMLVRDVNKDVNVNVPEPSTLAIFALGIIGLASRRFKQQS